MCVCVLRSFIATQTIIKTNLRKGFDVPRKVFESHEVTESRFDPFIDFKLPNCQWKFSEN